MTTLIAQGPVDVNVREPDDGFCPVCETNRSSLPAPAEGTCAYCYNHLMRPCNDCQHYRATVGDQAICAAPQATEQWSAWYARRNDDLCGAVGAWAVFPNV